MSGPKVLLTAVLIVPVLMVAGMLYFSVGSMAQANAAHRQAVTREAAARAAITAKPADGPKLVQPETLAQGFILIVQDKAGKSNADDPIYLAGSFNNWNPADPKFKLGSRSDMRWQIVMDQPASKSAIEFKFTRGSWNKCEVAPDLSDLGNRRLPMVDVSKLQPGEKPRIELTIERWRDERADEFVLDDLAMYRPLRVSGTVKRLQVTGGAAGAVGVVREVQAWLPPGYEKATTPLPVLYLMDGQHAFSKQPGTPGEWSADETAGRLIGEGQIEPVVIVAVPSSGARMSEYLPFSEPRVNAPPAGDEYLRWFLSEVKPRVERAFNVSSDPRRVAIGGASLGAAISLYGAVRHPDQFGMVLAESLPIRESTGWKGWSSGVKTWPGRVYIGTGDGEYGPNDAAKSAELVTATKEAAALIGGSNPSGVKLVVGAGDFHNEIAWAKRLPDALKFLFPPTSDRK